MFSVTEQMWCSSMSVRAMREFEQALKSQRAEIASVVAGQAQTDDVVEGVVKAMELLHTIVVDRAEEY